MMFQCSTSTYVLSIYLHQIAGEEDAELFPQWQYLRVPSLF